MRNKKTIGLSLKASVPKSNTDNMKILLNLQNETKANLNLTFVCKELAGFILGHSIHCKYEDIY